MKCRFRRPALMLLCGLFAAPLLQPAHADDAEKGFVSIFDGQTLKGWDGNLKFWRVEDGAITGQTTKDNPTKGNTFIVWSGGTTGDFELKLQYRIIGGNSGIQYRSFRLKNAADKWRIGGYQADIDSGDRFSGILYGEKFRGILADRGQQVELSRNEQGKLQKKVVEKLGDSKKLQKHVKNEQWNDYHIIAKGFHFTQRINGVTMSQCIDNDKKMRRRSGLLALQLHAGPPMKVQFRNIRIKRLSGDAGAPRGKDGAKKGAFRLRLNVPGVRLRIDGKNIGVDAPGVRVRVGNRARKDDVKKIVLIAGKRSHGYGAHEHKAGCMLLAKALNESGLPVKAVVVTGGWPKDTSVLQDADSIVIYADGGGRHPFNKHIEELDKLMKRGVGLVCIHYGVEVPKGKSGNAFLDWTGGYFETHWSVNPHWTAEYEKLPDHPVSRGVKPFALRDEWYYHMRFRPKMKGVTPILTDLPPKSTLNRRDGAHSNNPHVRKAVLERKQPQHTAWARERPDGGRGFGITGGHFHWNWGHNQFRKLVLGAIVWTAGVEVPKNGVPSKPLSVKDLMANQDYPVPKNFNPQRIQKMLDDWNRQTTKPPQK